MAPGSKVGNIDDVQELGKTKPSKIPERFIRDPSERPSHDQSPTSSDSIPIIDFSKLVKGNKDGGGDDDFCNEILKLRTACQDWGFFQVMKHGIEVGLVEEIEKVGMEFFKMPLEEKRKYGMEEGSVQGYGQAFVFSEDQKLDWCNMFALGLEPESVRKPHLWPTKPHHFSETVETYSREIRKLCKNMLKYIATSLCLNDDVFDWMFEKPVQAIRMNYYPPCPRPDLVLGLSPHSDGSGITVLQQGKDDPVGLQILKDNTWASVQPIPGALIINIGDTIEVLTNGRYKSVEHRAVANKEKERLSIVTFYAPSYEVEIGPMEEMVDENNPCKYRRYNHGEYNKHYVSSKLQGKKTLEFAKISSN